MKKIQFNIETRKLLGNLHKTIFNLIAFLPQDACIAGGFARDIAHKKPFKDIDILCKYTKKNLEFIKTAVSMVFKDAKFFEYDQKELEERGYKDPRICGVYKVEGIAIPIDIIMLDTYADEPIDYVSEFDLSLNQAWVKGTKFTPILYYNDSKAVHITNNKVLRDCIRFEERVARLKEKFPEKDWKEVDDALKPVLVAEEMFF